MIFEFRKRIWLRGVTTVSLRGRKVRAASLELLVTMTLLVFGITLGLPNTAGAQTALREGHAIWAHPPNVGKTAESVREFVAQVKRANIDIIVMDIKGMNGEIYWRSKKFPQAIAKGYESFDVLEHLTREAHAQGIKVDAWLVDFAEGEKGAAFREHPEWAMLNPDGNTTASETLGVAKRPYPYVWMCPARRPGYTDQWLLPMIEEIASNYAVDSIHHDYVRYPGDVSPDGYCFCDYCLKNIPRHAMLSYETRPQRFRVKHIQERIEANWWSDPTMIPADWPQRDRREMADYLLNGRSIPGGPPDMRYFFYDYRVTQIDRFVRETHERVKKINPKIEISAAVFKNPVQSARFIGQRWHEWSRWVDVFMPMTYRSHFAGSFEDYLAHLTEITQRQLEWTRREQPLYAGIASTYLYREEMQPLEDLRERVTELKNLPVTEVAQRNTKATAIKETFDLLRVRLKQFAPQREQEIGALVATVVADDASKATPEAIDKLTAALVQLRRDLPPGFCPPEKLTRAIEAARQAKPDGVIIFSAGNLTIEKLWPTLEAAFKR
ncbi:MAG TPA: putative glycoside hydrolase [Pyrinomonadaceae bacterium]|nr:putative glycoside hydrolase [Pyrinomonadaceae bacterium]